MRSPLSLELFCPYSHFFLDAFKIFLCFQSSEVWFWCVLLQIFLRFCLWFAQICEYVGMCFAKFEKFLTIISLSTFLSSSFLSSPFVSSKTYKRAFVIFPQAPETLGCCVLFCGVCFFPQSIFSMLFRWIVSTLLSSSSMILYSVLLLLLLNLSFQIFICSCISVLKCPLVLFFLDLLFLWWNFLHFHLFQNVYNCLLNYFYNDCFKIFIR